MKQSRFNRFALGSHCRATTLGAVFSLLFAIPALAAITPGGTNTYNGSTATNGLATAGSWTLGSPNSAGGAGSYTDLLFTGVDGSTFTSSGGGNTNIYAESYNVTNGSAYTLQLNSTTSASFQTGSTSSNGTSASTIAFTNSVSGIAQNVIHLSNGSDLTFNATNDGGGSSAVMNLRQTCNFDVGSGSLLTIHPAIIGGSGINLTISGSGNTVSNGANTYAGNTVVAGGTLEIAGSNASTSYSINGSGEPVLKLSNVSALPVSATIRGSDSTALDGTIDLAVAGAYTFGTYDRGHIKFTASSGSPTSLHFTGLSRITSGSNTARIFNNVSANLSIVFDSTLDIGGTVTANITITGAGDTTVTGDLLSTDAGARSLIKGGGGTLTLNGASAYTGTTTVSDGVLRLGNAAALPGGVGATGGTSSLVFGGTTGVIGLTTATGNFLRTVGTGPDQVTANPTADPALGKSMGFAAYGGDRIVDFGAPIQLSSSSLAGRDLTFSAADSDSKITLVNAVNLASSSRNIRVNDGSAAVDAEISGIIDSNGGTLVKSGSGTLALTGANTYGSVTGGTRVLAGVLIVNGTSLSDTSKLVIDGGVVQVTGTETVGTLFFGEEQKAPGTWGSSASSAALAFQDDTRFSGTGVIVVPPPSGSGYESWATANSAGLNLDDDHDGDGVPNGIEYFLGGPNGNTTGFTSLPGVTNTAGILSVTWTKGSGYTGVYGTHFRVETSATLADPWTVETVGVTVTDDPGFVKFTFPAGSKNFARLKVAGP